jgi:hypothetical protein
MEDDILSIGSEINREFNLMQTNTVKKKEFDNYEKVN